MRSKVINPPRPFTEKLRAAGYQVLWPGKTDFQGVSEKELADDRKAWVRFSKQPAGPLSPRPKEPFFAYFNDTVSHESQVRASDAEHAKDTGTRVPLIVRWPGQIAPGTIREDFASWIDLALTALTLAGVPVPAEYDGHRLSVP